MQRRLPFPASDALRKGGWMQFYMWGLPYLISPFVNDPNESLNYVCDRTAFTQSSKPAVVSSIERQRAAQGIGGTESGRNRVFMGRLDRVDRLTDGKGEQFQNDRLQLLD